MLRHVSPTIKFAIILLVFSILLTACGGNSGSGSGSSGDSGASASSDSGVTPLPTMPIPKENFKAHAENQITETTSVSSTQPASQTQAATTTTTTSTSTDDLARGSRSYTKNKCADCHGDKGEVIAGKTTKAIGGTTLAEDQFDQFLRTGGGLGDTHIFGPSAISPGGMQALYAYVKSLPGK